MVVFGPSLYFKPFIFDDFAYIFDNPIVLRPSLRNFLYYLGHSLTPIPFLLWKFLALIDTQSPFFFRLTNILLHGLNAFLVFKIATLSLAQKSKGTKDWPYWLSAFFYLLHPVQVESVVWISSFKTLLATSFALTFIFLSLHNSLNQDEDEEGKGITGYIPAILCYFFGLLCNPTMAPAIVIPLLILKAKDSKISPALLKVTGVTLLLAAMVSIGHKADVLTTYFDQLSFMLRLKMIFVGVSTYLFNVLFPFQLTFDYQINALSISYLDETSQIAGLLMIGPLALLTAIALTLKENIKKLGFFLLAFFILLTPHIGLILHDFNNISIVSDRYLNLALMAFSLFMAALMIEIVDWAKKHFERLPSLSVPLFLLIVLPLITSFQLSRWENPKELLKTSQNLMELRDTVLIAIGNQFVKEENFQQARISFKEALAANPQSSAALSSLLYVNELSPLEREDQFIVDYLAAQHINLTTDLYLPLARLYLRQNKFKEASNLMEGLKLHKVKAKDWEEINAINKVIENKKTKFALDAHKVLEAFYASELKYSQALKHVEEILKLEPGSPEYLKKRDDYQVEEVK